jgi:hypothetical protein
MPLMRGGMGVASVSSKTFVFFVGERKQVVAFFAALVLGITPCSGSESGEEAPEETTLTQGTCSGNAIQV